MINYLQYSDKYIIQVYNLIYNIMIDELEINSKTVFNITEDLKDIYNKYIKNGGNFWVAIDTQNNEVVGTVGILKIDDENAEFKRFYVKENYRNKHIGFKLYKMAENFAKKNKIKKLFLVSGNKSIKAHNIYYKNGWELTNKLIENVNIVMRDGVELYKKEIICERQIIPSNYKANNIQIDFMIGKRIRSLVG